MLAPDPSDAIDQLTGLLNAANRITQWVLALENTVLPPLDPQPAWYQEIAAALKTSQQHSQKWLNETAPDIVADTAASFIDYAGMFSNVVLDITPLLKLIAAQKSLPTSAQAKDLTEYVTALAQTAAAKRDTVRALSAAMKKYHAEMQADCAALKTAMTAALADEAQDQAAIQQVQTQIQSIELTLAADNTQATADDVNTQQALTGLVVTLAFSAGTIDPIAFGIALLGIGVDIAISAADAARVKADLAQIQTLSATLSTDQLQLGLLQGVISNLEYLSDGNHAALQTFDDVDDTWAFAAYGLNYLLVVLAQPQIDISKIPDLQDLGAAAAAWQQVAAFATKVQNATLTQQKTITISPK
jgi:Bacillus haemolytic enterotoxin (HBL)